MARRGVLQVHKCREMLSLPWRFESLWLVELRLPNASHPRCVGYADMPHSQTNDLEPTAGRKLSSPVTTHAGHCMQLPTTVGGIWWHVRGSSNRAKRGGIPFWDTVQRHFVEGLLIAAGLSSF